MIEFLENLRQLIFVMHMTGLIVIALYAAAWLVYSAIGCEYLLHDSGDEEDG